MQCATHWLFLFGIFGFLDRKKWIFRWKVLDFLVILFEFSVIFLVFWVNSFWISHPSHASSRGSHSLSARRGRKGRIQAGPKGPIIILTLCQSQLHSGVLLLWPDVAARGLWVSDSAEQWTGTLPSLCCLGGRRDDQMVKWSNGGRTVDQMIRWWEDRWSPQTLTIPRSSGYWPTDRYWYWLIPILNIRGEQWSLNCREKVERQTNGLVDSILAISLLTKKVPVQKIFHTVICIRPTSAFVC